MFLSLDHDATSPRVLPGSDSWRQLARLAQLLSALSLVWLGIEGAVGIWAGHAAHSIALVAFGLDSAIEGLASVVVIWRFTGARTLSPEAERNAQRLVAVSFYLLAPYVAAEAIEKLLAGAAAETSWLGIALTLGTLMICPWLGRTKQRIAGRLGSGAVAGEGTQNLLCAALAAAVLVGLAANSLLGVWWLDPAIALAIAAICVREGRRAWRGDQCGCASCDVIPAVIEDCDDCRSTDRG